MVTLIENWRDQTLTGFSARFNHALDLLDVPPKNQGRQVVVAKMFSVTQKGARKWLEAEGLPDRKKWGPIATRLRVRAEWLFYGRPPMREGNTSTGPQITAAIPLISWVTAGSWSDIVDEYPPGEGEKSVYTTKEVGAHAFALRVRGDSMENPRGKPTYPEGSIIIVDPDRAAKPGDRVVVRLEGSQEATFKVYREDAGGRYLMPLNPQYPRIDINGNATICGVVVQTIIDED